MSGVMVDLVAVILSGLRPHGGFGIRSLRHNDMEFHGYFIRCRLLKKE